MTSPKLIATLLAGTALMGATACDTINQPGVKGAGVGAVGGGALGYLLGDLIGGRNSRTAEIVGAGIGAVAGGAAGYYLDRQQKDLETRTAGTGVDVIRNGDSLTVRAPDAITFAYNQAAVRPEFRGTLQQIAESLQAYPSSAIDVLGHTDATGSDTYNQGLSEQRARSVADALTSYGVNRVRIETRGYGENQPIASNDTEEGRAANRRVEIRIVPVTQN